MKMSTSLRLRASCQKPHIWGGSHRTCHVRSVRIIRRNLPSKHTEQESQPCCPLSRSLSQVSSQSILRVMARSRQQVFFPALSLSLSLSLSLCVCVCVCVCFTYQFLQDRCACLPQFIPPCRPLQQLWHCKQSLSAMQTETRFTRFTSNWRTACNSQVLCVRHAETESNTMQLDGCLWAYHRQQLHRKQLHLIIRILQPQAIRQTTHQSQATVECLCSAYRADRRHDAKQ